MIKKNKLITGKLYIMTCRIKTGQVAFFDLNFIEDFRAKFTIHEELIGCFVGIRKGFFSYPVFLVNKKLGLINAENVIFTEVK